MMYIIVYARNIFLLEQEQFNVVSKALQYNFLL